MKQPILTAVSSDEAAFNAQITLKVLSYYGDEDLAGLPDDLKHRLQDAVLGVDLENLPDLGTPFSQRKD